MMKTNKIIYFFSFISILFLGSCDKDFEETNANPNDPASVPSSLLLGNTLRVTANYLQDTYLTGESALCWTQQLSKPQYNDGDLYKPRLGSIQNLWDSFYSSVIKDAQVMGTLAIEEGNEQMEGVSLIVQAQAFQILTDAFGHIPFKEAGVEGIFTPAYDSPQVVYDGIIAMLTRAATLLEGTGSIDSSQDILYSGDNALWIKYANSLKFRAIMRASSASGYSVGNQLKDLVASGKLFSSNSDEAKLQFLEADPNANPYYERLVLGGPARTAEWCMGEKLITMMDGTDLGFFDNRLPFYANEASDGSYTGLPAGLSSNPGNIFTDPLSGIGDKFLEAESYAYFVSYAQLSLLMAEAAEKGYINGSADSHYENGIKASFETVGATLGNYPVTYPGGSAGLKKIAQQSYIALFMQGYETWAEYRRTGIPNLTPAAAGVINQIPSRYSYPTDEQSDNQVSYKQAVTNQGADLLTTPIWWMQ